ncbi:hypothetical protein ABZV60_23090 [Streptomyces sp. NPDC004787]|uniref:hypothetical protein n=1 Tax=Streptomyces sp. NPDC004787 TaxID=3154291 RepID=UPI0033A86509
MLYGSILGCLIALSLAALSMEQSDNVKREGGVEGKAAACRTIDSIFTPRGIKGRDAFLKHMIRASDRLAGQSEGKLREAAETHATYARLMLSKSAESGSRETPQSAISGEENRKGLAAYGVIRDEAWNLCKLDYMKPAPTAPPTSSANRQ